MAALLSFTTYSSSMEMIISSRSFSSFRVFTNVLTLDVFKVDLRRFQGWHWNMFVHFQSDHLPSLKLTANAPENKNETQKKTRESSKTIHFQVRLLLVSGRLSDFSSTDQYSYDWRSLPDAETSHPQTFRQRSQLQTHGASRMTLSYSEEWKKHGCLGCRGAYTTRWYGDYNKPLRGSLATNQ